MRQYSSAKALRNLKVPVYLYFARALSLLCSLVRALYTGDLIREMIWKSAPSCVTGCRASKLGHSQHFGR